MMDYRLGEEGKERRIKEKYKLVILLVSLSLLKRIDCANVDWRIFISIFFTE